MTAADTRAVTRVDFPADPPELAHFDGAKGAWMSQFSAEYAAFLQTHVDRDLQYVPDRILAMLQASAGIVQNMQINQLEHGLITATMAERAGMDVDVVVAALCHDMGKVISTPNHSAIAAEMIKAYVHDDAYFMVNVHQDFEGIHYFGYMGLDPMMRLQHKDHPAYELAERFADEWDEKAFDPGYDHLPLEHFEPMVREVFLRPAKRPAHWRAPETTRV